MGNVGVFTQGQLCSLTQQSHGATQNIHRKSIKELQA